MGGEEAQGPKDFLDRSRTIASIFAAVAVPILIAWIGSSFASSQKDRELALNWVSLSLEILQDVDQNEHMRTYAVDTLAFYSEVSIPHELREALISGDALVPTPRSDQVLELQTLGVKALLERNVDRAVAYLDEAYRIWPTFRFVDEMRAYTQARAETLRRGTDADWRETYAHLVANMGLQGIEPATVAQLRAAAK